MADCIFTKQTGLHKSQLYNRIKDLMIGAGWQNLSSKPSTDFDVMYSTGEDNTKQLVVNLSEVYENNSLSTTTSQYMMARLPYSYTPGEAGVEGVFGRPADLWYRFSLFDKAVGPDLTFDLYYHVNKNRIIFFVEPSISSGMSTQGMILGMSNETLINENKGEGTMLAYTRGADLSADVVLMTSRPQIKGTSPYYLACFKLAVPKENCPDNTRILYKMAMGDAYEGVRGFIDGVLVVMGNESGSGYFQTTHGDSLVIGTAKYKVLNCKTGGGNCTWGHQGPLASEYNIMLAIRVE